jgi:hypothetical protein
MILLYKNQKNLWTQSDILQTKIEWEKTTETKMKDDIYGEYMGLKTLTMYSDDFSQIKKPLAELHITLTGHLNFDICAEQQIIIINNTEAVYFQAIIKRLEYVFVPQQTIINLVKIIKDKNT